MLNLYSETAFQVKAAPSSKRTVIQLPRANGSYDRSKYSKKPERSDRLATDDRSYAAEYLATASSVFFHQSHSFPRSFFWRIVSNEKTLELSNADFSRNEKDQEAPATLAFQFQDRISPRGISICDSSKSDEFYVFVLSQENEVFEIRLQTTFFQRPNSIPQDLRSWCSPIRASSLSIDKAFQVYASNPQDVFVSFASGKVQHWRKDDEHQQWSHINYDDKTWGSSFLSIVSRKAHPDIDFEGMRLAYNTTHAMVRSGQYIFTSCLNHSLRIWHLQSGKLVDSRDLLDLARDPQERVSLNPAEPGYIQFLEGATKHEQILMTYSPLNGGQVKLWRVRHSFDDDTELFSIGDMVPASKLSLPDPDPTGSSVWSLTGLKVIFDKQTKDWQAWVLWRNHNYHKAYTLNFGLTDVSNQWQNQWVKVLPVATKALAPDFVLADAQDVVSKWLEYLLFPGRYSTAVLETALSQFSTALDLRLSSSQRHKSLQEPSQVVLRKYDDSTMDYERFAVDTDKQWRQFWRILESMNEARFAPLALAADAVAGTVMLTMADMCCTIRECNNLELLQTNETTDLGTLQQIARSRWPYRKISFTAQDPSRVSVLLAAARKFLDSFSPELTADFLQTLDEDLYTETEVDTPQRIINFFNQIDFANAVSDDQDREFKRSLSALDGEQGITNDIYNAALQLVLEHKPRHGRPHQVKTDFGIQITMKALLEDIIAMRHALLSMLAVAIYVDDSENFDTARFFDALVQRLRTQERNLWLATHFRPTTPASGEDLASISILEDLYASAVLPQSTDHHPLPYLLTLHVKDNLHFISGESYLAPEEAAVYLQCNLLKHGDFQLASDFLKFQPPTPWSTYIKGRLCLALGNTQEASSYFRDASHSLAGGKALGKLQELSAGLLTADDASHFNGGLPLYLQHITALFESSQEYTEAAEAAHLALDALSDQKEPIPNFKQSILLRLFTSELKCSRFGQAYNALVQFTDPGLQRTSATNLIDTMLDSSSSLSDTAGVVHQIQALPLTAHPQLAQSIDSHLASLAKKQTTLPTVGGLFLSTSSNTDYLSILHALRLSRKDYRGAVAVLFDRLRIIQKSGRARCDPQATSLRHALLTLINTLTCVKGDEAYIIADSSEDPRIGGTARKRLREKDEETKGPVRKRARVIVTLDDLRREYQKVLDRCSRIERGDFEFGEEGADEDEEDGNEDGTWEGSKLLIDSNRTSGALVLSGGDAMVLT
ncbi:hypothetical protein LTR70_005524 [Exophiala xenobiotica]|uniref:Nuclear pore complex protein Nup160 n=1 Tax=Lithohypha guttulata TaxID=1690604 RepID=A0ABR0JVX6_9EURO|nr:hypothetical protein LTR24_009814 [Lithohypha guttulata]KAK5318380.1 hypothetical protein LTR70_005524 [Exophiala xenobiotica]